MPIIVSKYIDAKTGVAAGAAVRSRELIGRILSTSSVLQPGVVTEFLSLAEVGAVFASGSPEYQFAERYFGFVSKSNGGARKLSMARWAKTAAAAQVTGGPGAFGAEVLAALRASTALRLVTTNAAGVSTTQDITLNLTAASTFEAVRAAIQTAIRSKTDPLLAQANVLYTAATGVFTFQSGAPAVVGSVTAEANANPDIDAAYWLNWLPGRAAVVSAQTAAQSPLEAVSASLNLSDNFGSFGFLDSTVSPRAPLELEDVEAVSAWNHAQNVKFMFCALGSIPTAQEWYDTLKGYSGTALSLAVRDFAEFAPMIVLASIDYTRIDASTNYMFQQFDSMTPSVEDTTLSNVLDAVRMNYIGSVMQAGQQLAFYQRGVLMGGPSLPVDMSAYCNEIWLKDDIVTTYLTMLLTLNRVPANDAGRAIVMTNLQTSVNRALDNGVISVGKLLTSAQKQSITQMTNDPEAWQQVQTAGYVLNVWIKSIVTTDGRTEYVAVYQLIYAKDDQIRKVEGTNNLI